jgi:hypothetical protein
MTMSNIAKYNNIEEMQQNNLKQVMPKIIAL